MVLSVSDACLLFRRHAPLLFLILLAGCGGGGEDDAAAPVTPPTPTAPPAATVADAIARVEAQPSSPRLDYGTSLIGPDANANGIRDDIDRYLATTTGTPAQRKFLTDHAADLNSVLTTNVADQTLVLGTARRMGKTIMCGPVVTESSVLDASVRTLEKYTFNTPERIRHYAKFNAALDSSSWSSDDFVC